MVGGVAVVLHGYLRTIADLNVVVQLTQDNIARAMDALAGLGYRPRAQLTTVQFADPETRESWVRHKGLTVLSLWSDTFPTLEVEAFVDEPFDFLETHARAVRVPLDVTVATVIGLDDLIERELVARRPVDLDDIKALRALGGPGRGHMTSPHGGPSGADSYDDSRRSVALLGLRLTPAERLRWLEETMATLRRWQGRARSSPGVVETTGPGRRVSPGRTPRIV